MALVLTGMGSDGLSGAKAIVAAGGHVMAQDEETSVVWGMPGQVANAGLCSAVLPLQQIPPLLSRLFVGERAHDA
jgi:two-component system chemotaxis response regulator CheB